MVVIFYSLIPLSESLFSSSSFLWFGLEEDKKYEEHDFAQWKKNSTKMLEKQDQKVVLVSLSIHINLEHEEHTQKNKTQINLYK